MVKELKHTEIGDIPVDWELQTFDETFRVISNNTLSRENLNNRGGAVRNIHYGDILTKFPEVLDCNEEEIPYVNELSLLSSSTQLLQDGDIVVADTAEDETVGKVIEVQNLGDSKLVAGLHTIPCRVKKGDFAPGWLGYYMNSDLFHNQILPYITGIKVSSISKGAISETLILVPPFDEQEKIVQSLNKIQLLMTSETKVVNKIKLVKNGCLSKMFPQKDDTVPEMRLPGFTEAWEQRKVSEIAIEKLSNGIMNNQSDGETGVKHINVINMYDTDKIHPEKLAFSNYEEDAVKKCNVEFGDIFLTRSSLKPEGIAEANVLLNSGRFVYDDHLIRVKVNKEKYDPFFVKLNLSGNAFKRQFIVRAKTTAFTTIGQEDISECLGSFPKKEEQQQIGECFMVIDHLITLHQCKCDKYSNIKKGMMSDLLTGKIRLV